MPATISIAIPQDEAAAAAQQVPWLREVADSIERGVLPTSELERLVIAAIIRAHAAGIEQKPRKRRGNPNLKARIPGDVALIAYGRIVVGGQPPATVFADLAEMYGVDESTIAKAYRGQRASIAAAFPKRNSKS